MNFLITGFPGTGKTAVARELKQRGYVAYDPEAMRGFMHLESRQTGRPIHMPQEVARGWFDTTGAFNWDITRVPKLLSQDKTVFICSLANNMEDLWDKFEKVFVLQLDDVELEQRIRARGKHIDTTPELLADTLMLRRHFETSLLNRGAVPINAHPATSAIADRIIAQSL